MSFIIDYFRGAPTPSYPPRDISSPNPEITPEALEAMQSVGQARSDVAKTDQKIQECMSQISEAKAHREVVMQQEQETSREAHKAEDYGTVAMVGLIGLDRSRAKTEIRKSQAELNDLLQQKRENESKLKQSLQKANQVAAPIRDPNEKSAYRVVNGKKEPIALNSESSARASQTAIPEGSSVQSHEMPSVLSKNSIPPTRIDKGEKKAQTTPAVSVKEKVEVPKPKSKPVVKAPAPKPVVKPAAVSIKPEVKKPNVNVSRPKPKAAPPRSMPANLKPSFKVSKPKAPSGSIPSSRNISRLSSSGNSRPSGNHTFGRGFF